MQKITFLLMVFCFSWSVAQEKNKTYIDKKIAVTKDTIWLEKKSINSSYFKIITKNKFEVDSLTYTVNFKKGYVILNNNFPVNDSITISYLNYPEFLTKKYSKFEKAIIAPEGSNDLYVIKNNKQNTFKPFDGLSTTGSITRGVTIGNNQNATVNSNLDLQITGKLSDKVSIRASIQDSNIPLQDNGYSQRLDEFDQIFIELFTDKWNIKAGDLFIENRSSKYLNFNKKVQGLATQFNFGNKENKTEIIASGAIVRGQYAKSSFAGLEGNQGPYKLRGSNGELFVLVISGSERVFVNGNLLVRGENNQYTIDYNAGEITFTSLFPITSEMRIVIEYQYSERSFTRFVTYGGAMHTNKKWSLGGFLFSENDVKNQPLQQNLTQDQVAVLQNAGDDSNLMIAPSAFEDSFSENKILYKKTIIGTTEIFEFSNNPNDVLFNVRFLFVGNNQGNYIVANNQAIGKIYQYIAPVSGIPQGNFEPIIRLIAPTKLQIATVLGKYNPSEKTLVDFELAVSNNDKNLFSTITDQDNQGFAGKFNINQRLVTKKYNLDAFANFQLIQKNFKPIERIFTIEFNRDWNILNPLGNQSLFVSGLKFKKDKNINALYQIEKLDFSENYSGLKQVFSGQIKTKKLSLLSNSSIMNGDATVTKSNFIRSENIGKFHFKKNWIGASFRHENIQEKNKSTQQLNAISQKFSEYGSFIGRGDTTKVFIETGFLFRKNDSLQNTFLQRVNTSNSYFVKSRLIKTEKSNLTFFVNYRELKFTTLNRNTETSLNSRLLYNDSYFKKFIQTSTSYETLSGTIPQQEFTYLEVEPGQGVYMWNDYNNNGVQELQEFEVAPFPDLAKYVRVFLPNQVFVQTHQIRFAQTLTINPAIWSNKKGFKKLVSRFYNQTAFNTDRKIFRNQDNFNFNPFTKNQDDLIGLNLSFRNSLFYNRAKQKHSTTYSFLSSQTQNLLSAGLIAVNNNSHQLQYQHLIKEVWLLSNFGKTINIQSFSENFTARNFNIKGYQITPKISYLFTKNNSLDVFYEYQFKENLILNQENLKQNRYGISFNYTGNKKFTAAGEFSFYNNSFTGNAISVVGFQLLEGLQPGKNQTWRLSLQKNITQYLDINLNYQGRKSQTSSAIHTGNIQLRAFF